jgi:hypothetical protein
MCWVEKTSGPALPPVTISALCGAPLPPAAYLKPILVKKKSGKLATPPISLLKLFQLTNIAISVFAVCLLSVWYA